MNEGLEMLSKPNRAKYMAGLASNIEAVEINDAIMKANLRRLYPEGIDLPEGKETIIGGDVTIQAPAPPPPPPAPKPSNALALAIGFLAAVLLAIALAGGLLWWLSSPQSPVKPPVTSTEDYNVKFWDES